MTSLTQSSVPEQQPPSRSWGLNFLCGISVFAILLSAILAYRDRASASRHVETEATLNRIAAVSQHVRNVQWLEIAGRAVTRESDAKIQADKSLLKASLSDVKAGLEDPVQLDQLSTALTDYLESVNAQRQLIRSEDFEEARRLDFGEISPEIDAIHQQIREAATSHEKAATAASARSQAETFAAGFLALTVIIILGIRLKARHQAETGLRNSELQYRLLFECNPVPMWLFETSTLRFLAVNEAAVRQYGYSKEEFASMTIADIRPEEDVPDLLKAVARPVHGLQEPEAWRHRKKDGSIIFVEIVSHDMDFHGTPAELVAAHDVTERKRSEEALQTAEEKYRSIFEDAVVGIFQTTPEGRPLSVNRSFARMHGYDSPEVLLSEVSKLADLFVNPRRLQELTTLLTEQNVVSGIEAEVYSRDRARKWVSINLRTVRDASGRVALYEGTVENITDRKVAEDRIEYLAYYDALTGLPNRSLLQDRLSTALAGARRRNEKAAVLFLDLDRFKVINDSLGHSFGDLLLREVAERLKKWARSQDTVARIGGDEFIILLNSVRDVSDVAIAAERIMDVMTADFVIQGRSFSMMCSIGISVFPENGSDSETLIKNADAAMYCAKESGRNAFRFFTEDMNAEVVERLTIEHGLRGALDRNELFLMYQPQMDLTTRKIVGLEALLRWRHPELGLVPPNRFIKVAENSGLIIPIGEWVIRTACAQAKRWQDFGLPAVPVAVNVSAIQFRKEGLLPVIEETLQETGLAPQYLELELTESLLLSTADVIVSFLRRLKAMGLRLAIDDFGTGYSSLSYLRQLPVHRLKIDRSFIKDVAINSDAAAIATAIISMAKNMNLKTIAEGVENDAQISFLREHHCDEIQGYFFSKPLTVTQATDLMLKESPACRTLPDTDSPDSRRPTQVILG